MIDEKKKMTAQGSSVGADDGQSISQNSKTTIPDPDEKSNSPERDLEELYRKMRRMSDPAYLHTVTLDELMDNVFEGKSAVIENLLYTGAYILAGAPKIGKSFLVAQIAHHVSTGQDLWEYKVHQGTVLYLALEDDESRLQRRMFRMFGVEGTSSLHFATNAKMIGGGLDEQLEKFVREHSDTKLIIVDTLQKVREAVSDSYSYSSDYEVIGKLKQFADRYGVCVLIVHHTRKQPAGDSFEMISGTTGLLGCADGALLMQKEKRTDSKATLEVVGRDQPDQRLYHYAVSNPFFEIWLLLHHDQPSEEDKSFAVSDSHSYEKTSHFRTRLSELGAPLKDKKHINFSNYNDEKIKTAVHRAEELHVDKTDMCPRYFATTVYLLLKKIFEMLPEEI